jgi:hypothetical protein
MQHITLSFSLPWTIPNKQQHETIVVRITIIQFSSLFLYAEATATWPITDKEQIKKQIQAKYNKQRKMV